VDSRRVFPEASPGPGDAAKSARGHDRATRDPHIARHNPSSPVELGAFASRSILSNSRSCFAGWSGRLAVGDARRVPRESAIRTLRSLSSVVSFTRLHVDLELFRAIGDDSLEPFRRVADSSRSTLGALDIAIDMLGQY
jgi:hypothetical protein